MLQNKITSCTFSIHLRNYKTIWKNSSSFLQWNIFFFQFNLRDFCYSLTFGEDFNTACKVFTPYHVNMLYIIFPVRFTETSWQSQRHLIGYVSFPLYTSCYAYFLDLLYSYNARKVFISKFVSSGYKKSFLVPPNQSIDHGKGRSWSCSFTYCHSLKSHPSLTNLCCGKHYVIFSIQYYSWHSDSDTVFACTDVHTCIYYSFIISAIDVINE